MDISDTLRTLIPEPPDLRIRYTFPTLTDLSTTYADQDPATSSITAGLWYVLSLRAQELRLADPFEQLLAPAVLAERLIAHPHQRRVVADVLREKVPAAILADEVGLGKTIEAGLILKELVLRGLARTALVITPKALVLQWQEELRERFDEDFVVPDEPRFNRATGYQKSSRLICSFQQLVRAFDQIGARAWDILIVDEAHLLANPEAKRRHSIAHLRTRWRLLLTATPLQNKITDLYSLVDLVSPGRLGTLRQFISSFAADPTTCRRVVPAKLPELRQLAQDVMCRTRRADTGITFPSRKVETYLIPPLEGEAAMMRNVTEYLRALYRQGQIVREQVSRSHAGNHAASSRTPGDAASSRRPPSDTTMRKPTVAASGALIREIVALQQSLSSSPQAIAASLQRRAQQHADEREQLMSIARMCGETPSAKEQLLLDAIRQLGGEQVLIFTLRLETARRLRELLMSHRRTVDCYIGELETDRRRDIVQRFSTGAINTLIATDAGAEGLNLQERCHIVFNYDLHWNPMKMEQRIGRVHRLGQAHDVTVANFVLAGSIDEYVLNLLYQKVDLFTMTIGALDTLLSDLDDGEIDIERRIVDLLLAGDSEDNAPAQSSRLSAGIGALRQELIDAMAQVQSATALTTEVLG